MKDFLRKISTFLLAVIVLFSSTSMTVGQHFCGEMLVNYSILGSADSCGMEMDRLDAYIGIDCPSIDMDQDCCEDVVVSYGGDLEIEISFNELTFDQQVFLACFTYSYINLYDGLEQNIVPFRDYAPPVIIRDINVLNETFLI